MQRTDKRRQWLWFAGLLIAGMAAFLILAGAMRLVLRLATT